MTNKTLNIEENLGKVSKVSPHPFYTLELKRELKLISLLLL